MGVNTVKKPHEKFRGDIGLLFLTLSSQFLLVVVYAFLIDWPDTLLGKIYFFISLLGHFSFCVFALYLLVIFPLSFIIKNHRTFRGLTVIIATICTTLLLLIRKF